MRIDVPCRSTACSHNQCFDAASYLQLQEQAPTWTCPICNKPAPYGSLQVDLYVDDILKSTSSSTEQVTIEPDGQWHKQGAMETARKDGNPTPDHDDEGFVVIGDDRVSSLKQDSRLKSVVHTPMSSREQSIASSAARSSKRPASEVIDLTLSDDDEAPPSKIKRPSMSSSESFRSRPYDNWSIELQRLNLPSSYANPPFSMNS
jgi:E3 SUMO-protein ligase PIAS1